MSNGKRSRIMEFLSGDFIVNRGLDRHIGFVFYIFALVCLAMFWSLMVESRLIKVRDNAKIIESLEIARDQRAIELLGIDHCARVEELLKKNHSTLTAPTVPPVIIED